MLTALAGAVWAAVAFPVSARLVQAVDDRWHDAMAAGAWAPLIGLSQALAVVGGAWVTIPLRALVALWFWHRKRWTALAIWVASVIPAQGLTLLGKALYARPRPADRLVEAWGGSFPSGHTTNAAVMALTLVLLLAPPGPRRRWWWVLAIGWALLMAWSRTYLRVHWLSDVTAGLLWGSACAVWSATLVPRFGGYRETGSNS